MTRIFDCFTFHNEVDLLRLRVRMIGPVVDHIVIAEATQTHAGAQRTLQLDPELLNDFGPKVSVVVVDDMPGGDAWARENHQRRAIARGLARLDAAEGDVVVLSDVDEIPNPAVVERLPSFLGERSTELTMRYFQYRLNLEIEWPWPLARAARWHPGADLQLIREESNIPAISGAGWHFTYLGDENRAREKLRDFAHQELAGVYDSPKHIERCLRWHVDLMGRYPMRTIDPSELPVAVLDAFADRPEMWAEGQGRWQHAVAFGYMVTTRRRPRLGAGFCDRHPMQAFLAATGLATGSKARRLVGARGAQ